MRALLGARGLLQNCKYLVRWCIKENSFLPQKDACERAKAKRLIHLTHLRRDDAKEPETPALEMLCRALSSSSGSASSSHNSKQPNPVGPNAQQAKCSSGKALSNKTPNIPLIPPENIKPEPEIQLEKAKSDALQVYSCKTCHEDGSGEDLEASGLKLKSCQNTKGSVLKVEQPAKPLPSAAPKAQAAVSVPQEKLKDNIAKPPNPAGKQGVEKSESAALKPNSCANKAMKAVPSPKAEKMEDNCNKPEMESKEKSHVKPSQEPKSQTPKEWKQPPLPTSPFSFPLLAAFPLGRNPCRDGPRGGGCEKEAEPKSQEKCLAPKDEPKEEPCLKEVKETCPSLKPNSFAEKDTKAESCPKAETKKDVKPSQDVLAKPKEQKVKKDDSPKAAPQSTSALPLGRDGSPGKCEKKADDPKENILSSGKEITNAASLDEQVADILKKCEAKANEISDSAKSGKTPTPPKEIKEPSTQPVKEASTQPVKEAVKASEELMTDTLDFVSCKEESKHSESENSPKLKNFPAAPLKRTLTAYLDSIEPFFTKTEFETELKLTNEFEEGEGQQLQQLLEEAANNCSNWLTPRWTQAAYLAYQAPVTAFTSPALSFPLQKFKDSTDCLIFTARAICAIAEFKELVDQNKIPVAKMGDNELDNSQFTKIFGTVRKPGRFCDTIKQCSESDYVVVAYQNNYFQLPIYSSSGKLLSVTSLADELEAIINCPLPKGESYGLLTHDNRGNWAEAYCALCRQRNVDTIEAIEQSLFLVCLDECVPIPKGQEFIVQAQQLLHGGGLQENSANRWMDKTIQLIVNPNGLAGFCYEHSPADCQPLAMLMDYVVEKIKCASQCESEECQKVDDNSNPARHLKLHPKDECLNLWLHVAMRNINKIAGVLRINVLEYQCHGKDFIMAQGLNSDSYIQMALQLAYYNMHKTLPAQYESAHLRMFVDGRTETIRSTSNESKAFVLAMNSEKATEIQKLAALHKAVDAHEQLTKRALNGEGIDRHLFGLQQMAVENDLPMPEFFKSKGFLRSVTFQLFTSQVATSNKSFMTYGPLTDDGYGCCYNPHEDMITFAISAWPTSITVNPEKYGKAIKKSLDTMRRLILNTGGERYGEHPCHCEPILI